MSISGGITMLLLSLCLLSVLTAGTGGQPPTPKISPTPSGACAGVDWACAAQCVDRKCADRCLGPQCVKALAALGECARGACIDAEHCASDACRSGCVRAYGPPRTLPEARTERARDVCSELENFGGHVDESLVGKWELSAASVGIPEEQATKQGTTQLVRADFQRWIRFTPRGCYVQETTLKLPTLKPGNDMVIRAWGVAAQEKKKVTLEIYGGQATGALCGEGFVSTPKRAPHPKPRSYEVELEGEDLTLSGRTEEKQTFKYTKLSPDAGVPGTKQ